MKHISLSDVNIKPKKIKELQQDNISNMRHWEAFKIENNRYSCLSKYLPITGQISNIFARLPKKFNIVVQVS